MKKRRIGAIICVSVGMFCVLMIYFKFYFMLVSSIKNNNEIISAPFVFPARIEWRNYIKAFEKVITYLGNSISVTGSVVIGVFIVGTLTAYIFARFDFPFKNAIFVFILSFMMIPDTLTLIPSFVLITKLRLVNTFWAVILPQTAGCQIIYILVMRSVFESIPQDLFSAADIDGASHIQKFFNIVLPLSKAMLISMLLMTFLASWNDFIWPLLTLSKESLKTVTVGLYSFADAQQIMYGEMFAGFTIASVPLILLFGFNMKHFITGITSGAIKA